jgi:hypothetical protein
MPSRGSRQSGEIVDLSSIEDFADPKHKCLRAFLSSRMQYAEPPAQKAPNIIHLTRLLRALPHWIMRPVLCALSLFSQRKAALEKTGA